MSTDVSQLNHRFPSPPSPLRSDLSPENNPHYHDNGEKTNRILKSSAHTLLNSEEPRNNLIDNNFNTSLNPNLSLISSNLPQSNLSLSLPTNDSDAIIKNETYTQCNELHHYSSDVNVVTGFGYQHEENKEKNINSTEPFEMTGPQSDCLWSSYLVDASGD